MAANAKGRQSQNQRTGAASTGPPGGEEQPRALARLRSALAEVPVLRRARVFTQAHASLALSALLTLLAVLRIFAVANFDTTTALGLVSAGGTLSVLLGALLVQLPLALTSFGAMIFVLFMALARQLWDRGDRGDAIRLTTINAGNAVVLAVAGEWWLVLGAFVLGLALFVLGLPRPQQDESEERGLIDRSLRYVLVVAGTGLVLWAVLDTTMWLPGERILVRSDTATGVITGYVVEEEGPWTTVLDEPSRRLLVIPSSAIQSRSVCRGSGQEDRRTVLTLLGITAEPPPPCGKQPLTPPLGPEPSR